MKIESLRQTISRKQYNIKQLFAEGKVNIAEYLPRQSRGK